MVSGRTKKYSDEEIEALGNDILETMSDPECWHLEFWSVKQDKSSAWVHELAKDYPVFSEYLTRARKKLGCKYASQAMTKNPSSWMVQRYMPHWLGDKDWLLEDVAKEEKVKAEAKVAAGSSEEEEINEKTDKILKAVQTLTEAQGD